MNPDIINKTITAHFPGFRSKHLRQLRESLGSIGDAVHCQLKKFRALGFSERLALDFLHWREETSYQALFQALKRSNIEIIFFDDPEYPELLKQTTDPPEVLFLRGTIPRGTHISFVGSRKYSLYGQTCVSLLVPDAVKYGVVTVSGLALGIDGLVHKKTIDSGGKTIAVLGSGVDYQSIYPRSHAWLADRIIESGGALISEFPPGTPARKEHFPIRNRIIAGFSRATVVIEANQKSGSLITARLALEENRDVFAVPGPITKSTSRGTNALLSAGAIPCTNFNKVLDGLQLDPQVMAAESFQKLPLNLEEREILRFLGEETHADELAENVELDPATIGSTLSSLELKGAVRQTPSKKWIRA